MQAQKKSLVGLLLLFLSFLEWNTASSSRYDLLSFFFFRLWYRRCFHCLAIIESKSKQFLKDSQQEFFIISLIEIGSVTFDKKLGLHPFHQRHFFCPSFYVTTIHLKFHFIHNFSFLSTSCI